jgi:hypothetical protein
MIQSFQCPTCGNLNPIGEPSCPKCGQSFVYNCPVCGNPIDNRYLRCASCNTLFNWSKPILQNAETRTPNMQRMRVMYPETKQPQTEINEVKEKPNSPTARMTSQPKFWLMLMAGCMILIAILLIMDRVINH